MGRPRADPYDMLSRALFDRQLAAWAEMAPILDLVRAKFGGRLTGEIVGLHLRHIGSRTLIGVANSLFVSASTPFMHVVRSCTQLLPGSSANHE